MNLSHRIILFAAAILFSACASDIDDENEDLSAQSVAVDREALCNLCDDQHDIGISPDGEVDDGEFTGNGSCYAYKDQNFGGGAQTLSENWQYTYVGDSFNDKISSFRLAASNCHILAWADKNKGGVSTSFWSDTLNVGSTFNDRISSWACLCD